MTAKRAQVVDRHLARLKIRREKARRVRGCARQISIRQRSFRLRNGSRTKISLAFAVACFIPAHHHILLSQQMAEKRRMEEAAENFEEYEPEEPPSDKEEEKLVQQDIFIHCVRNRKPEHVPVHIFLRLPGQFNRLLLLEGWAWKGGSMILCMDAV